MDILSATILECLNTTLSEFIQSYKLHLCRWFKRPTSPGPSLAPRDYPGPHKAKMWKGPNSLLLLSATLIEAPHPQEVNYLAGKEAPRLEIICCAIITANTATHTGVCIHWIYGLDYWTDLRTDL